MNYKTFRILLLSYMGLILIISSLPNYTFSIETQNWIEKWDKLIHLFEYFILGILAMNSMKNNSIISILGVIAFGIIFGSIDEYLQSFISGRFSSGLDVLADAIGVTIGALLVIGNKSK